jgi:hypothetical protein
MQSVAIQAPSLTTNLPTSVTQILAAPAGSAGFIVTAVTFANKSAGNVTVQCSVFNGTTDFYLVFNASIAPGDTLVLGGGNLKLQTLIGYSLRALCNTASAVDVTVHYSQFT